VVPVTPLSDAIAFIEQIPVAAPVTSPEPLTVATPLFVVDHEKLVDTAPPF
jgi:hypothetical protein